MENLGGISGGEGFDLRFHPSGDGGATDKTGMNIMLGNQISPYFFRGG
jgi:hypothetical protein